MVYVNDVEAGYGEIILTVSTNFVDAPDSKYRLEDSCAGTDYYNYTKRKMESLDAKATKVELIPSTAEGVTASLYFPSSVIVADCTFWFIYGCDKQYGYNINVWKSSFPDRALRPTATPAP